MAAPELDAPLSPAAPPGLSGRSLLILLAYGASLYAFGLLWPRALTFHETLFAQPAREAVASGNWVVLSYAGRVWDDKPPLTPWLIATSMALFGTTAEWAVHLPNVLVTLLGAVLVAWLTARWAGDLTGRLAGLIQFTTFYTLMQGRLAEADMPLGVTVLAAMCVFALANVDGPRPRATGRGWPVLFFACAGLTFLAKGPIGPAFVGLPCGLYAIVQRDRRIWRFLLDPLGWGVFLFLLVAWPFAVYRADPSVLAGWWSNNFGRFSGDLAETATERQPLLFYLYMCPLMLLPWTPTLAWGLARPWLSRDRGPVANPTLRSLWFFLLLWFAVGFVLLTLSSWKAKHYAIPILFAATPFIAAAFHCDLHTLLSRWSPKRVLGVAFGSLWAICVAVELVVQPHFDDYRFNAELARRLNDHIPPGETVYFLTGDVRPHLAYYLAARSKVTGQTELEPLLRDGTLRGAYLVTQPIFRWWLADHAALTDVDRTTHLRPNENPLLQLQVVQVGAPATRPATAPASTPAR